MTLWPWLTMAFIITNSHPQLYCLFCLSFCCFYSLFTCAFAVWFSSCKVVNKTAVYCKVVSRAIVAEVVEQFCWCCRTWTDEAVQRRFSSNGLWLWWGDAAQTSTWQLPTTPRSVHSQYTSLSNNDDNNNNGLTHNGVSRDMKTTQHCMILNIT